MIPCPDNILIYDKLSKTTKKHINLFCARYGINEVSNCQVRELQELIDNDNKPQIPKKPTFDGSHVY